MKTITKTFGRLLIIAIIGGMGFLLGKMHSLQPQRIPHIAEIQEMVGAKPDGVLGKETQEKWESAVWAQCERGIP